MHVDVPQYGKEIRVIVQELDLDQIGETQQLKDWLKGISMPIVLLVKSAWRRWEKGETIFDLLKALAEDPRFNDRVLFHWFSADERGRFCRELNVNDAPCLLILSKGIEVAKFTDIPNKEMIIRKLSMLVGPSASRYPAALPVGSVPGESPYHP